MKKYQMASTIRNMTKSLPPSRTAPQFVVRFPDAEMRDRIKQEAESSGRSMNAQIVFMLQAQINDIDRENYENSPEYWEELERASKEAIADMPEGKPFPPNKNKKMVVVDAATLERLIDKNETMMSTISNVADRLESLAKLSNASKKKPKPELK